MNKSILLFCLSCLLLCWTASQLKAQPPIVLRDLSLIRDKSISEFDNSGVTLSDGGRLGWAQILKATVSAERQSEFDLKLNQLGLPLFRLRSRIGNGDWLGAGEIAKPIYESGDGRTLASMDNNIAYLVCLTTMKCRLHQGNSAEALLPFAQASILQPQVDNETLKIAGSGRLPKRDVELMLSSQILPIWFDQSRLKRIVADLNELTEQNGEQTALSPGLKIYLASMKIELGQTDEAMRLLRSLASSSQAQLNGWPTVLEARIHQKTRNGLNSRTILESNSRNITGPARAVALYYRGINVLHESDIGDLELSKAMLTLLRIPAVYGETHRELSAAALYQSAEIAKHRGREGDSQKLQEELLRRYPRTYHGVLETTKRHGNRTSVQ